MHCGGGSDGEPGVPDDMTCYLPHIQVVTRQENHLDQLSAQKRRMKMQALGLSCWRTNVEHGQI